MASHLNNDYTAYRKKIGRSPGEANGNPLQYSCLENSMCPWLVFFTIMFSIVFVILDI